MWTVLAKPTSSKREKVVEVTSFNGFFVFDAEGWKLFDSFAANHLKLYIKTRYLYPIMATMPLN